MHLICQEADYKFSTFILYARKISTRNFLPNYLLQNQGSKNDSMLDIGLSIHHSPKLYVDYLSPRHLSHTWPWIGETTSYIYRGLMPGAISIERLQHIVRKLLAKPTVLPLKQSHSIILLGKTKLANHRQAWLMVSLRLCIYVQHLFLECLRSGLLVN